MEGPTSSWGLPRLMGLCALCLLPILVLRKNAPEQALLLVLAIAAVVTARVLALAAPLLEQLRTLFDQAGVDSSHVSILLRTVAAALVSRLCGDLCRDSGSQALGTVVELAGAAAALLISLPLLEAVAGLLMGYFT